MNSFSRGFALSFLVMAAGSALAACGGGYNGPPVPISTASPTPTPTPTPTPAPTPAPPIAGNYTVPLAFSQVQNGTATNCNATFSLKLVVNSNLTITTAAAPAGVSATVDPTTGNFSIPQYLSQATGLNIQVSGTVNGAAFTKVTDVTSTTATPSTICTYLQSGSSTSP